MKAEALALSFGALIILVTFGDDYLQPFIGNLDTIFGLSLWKVLDVLYPTLTILVFLFYGRLKGGSLKLDFVTLSLVISFLVALFLINIDDFLQVLSVDYKPSQAYWTIIMWVYPFYAAIAFLLFGERSRISKTVYAYRRSQ
jgi:hypothetical protein